MLEDGTSCPPKPPQLPGCEPLTLEEEPGPEESPDPNLLHWEKMKQSSRSYSLNEKRQGDTLQHDLDRNSFRQTKLFFLSKTVSNFPITVVCWKNGTTGDSKKMRYTKDVL